MGLLNRLAIIHNIPSYVATPSITSKLTKKKFIRWSDQNLYPYQFRKFNTRQQKKLIKLSKENLNSRLAGNIDYRYKMSNPINPVFDGKTVIKKNNHKNKNYQKILIVSHCLSDAPHVYGKTIFPDFHEWLNFLGRISLKKQFKNYLWYIKPHPAFYKKERFYYNSLVKKYKNFQLIQEKINIPLKSHKEIAYAYLLKKVYHFVADKSRFYEFFQEVYQAQWQSKSLLNPELPRSELAAISARKGAVSAWVFRSLIAEPISPEELNMLEQLGYLGQFMDDIFDLYDDHQEGLQTLANDYSGDFTPVYEKFLMEIEELKVLIQKLPFSKNRKMCFQRELMLMVSGGILACQHFLKVQRKYGHLDIQNIPRKELIVDMESKKNHVKMLLLALKYA
jgi:hypothetical protein